MSYYRKVTARAVAIRFGVTCALMAMLAAFLSAPAWSDAPVAPGVAVPPAADCRVRIERSERSTEEQVWLDVRYPEDDCPDLVAVFDCTGHCRGNVDIVRVSMILRNAEGVVCSKGDTELSFLRQEDTCQFRWDAAQMPTGVYTARLEWRDRPEYVLGWSEFVVRKVSLQELSQALDGAEAKIRDLQTRLDDAAAAGHRFPYLAMQLFLATDYIGIARNELTESRWRHADGVVRYTSRVIDEVRAQLTFAKGDTSDPAPRASMTGLKPSGGVLMSGDRPVYLFGLGGFTLQNADIQRVSRYGFNLISVTVTPRDTLISETETADAATLLGPLFEQATAANVAVIIDLAPDNLPSWAVAKWPEMICHELGTVHLANPKTRELTERHMKALLPWLAQQPQLQSVCLADRPKFRFEGEEVRKGFLEVVKSRYADRHIMNRSWQAHLADFNDIDISRGHKMHEYQEKPAFQYDWQTYHMSMAADYFRWLIDRAHALAPGVMCEVKSLASAFTPGESRWAADPEVVTGLMDAAGYTAELAPTHPFFAFMYPHQSAHYALVRSFAPEKLVLNLENQFLSGGSAVESGAFNESYAHSAMWESVMSGMTVSVAGDWVHENLGAPTQEALFTQPECIEGYARACLDINRLSDIIAAFQKAPFDVAILWSMPSKIFRGADDRISENTLYQGQFDGEPYLSSARDAFEGCSFGGYKTGFVTDRQCAAGALDQVKVLVIPETPSLPDAAFKAIQAFIEKGGVVSRLGQPIPYNEWGHSRHDSVGTTAKTILVRGVNLPTEYLHAIDGVMQFDALPEIPRAVNEHGFPLEGVRTQYVEINGEGYLYLLNLRKEPMVCHLAGDRNAGEDLILGREFVFPTTIHSLDPMLIRLYPAPVKTEPVSADDLHKREFGKGDASWRMRETSERDVLPRDVQMKPVEAAPEEEVKKPASRKPMSRPGR